jgi:hypothetical protein
VKQISSNQFLVALQSGLLRIHCSTDHVQLVLLLQLQLLQLLHVHAVVAVMAVTLQAKSLFK